MGDEMQKPLLEFEKFGHQIHLLVEKEANLVKSLLMELTPRP